MFDTYREDAFDLVAASERAPVSRVTVQAEEHVDQVLLFVGGSGLALVEVAVDDALVERVELMEVPLQAAPHATERVQPPEPRHVVGDPKATEKPLRLLEYSARVHAAISPAAVAAAEGDTTHDVVARGDKHVAQVHGRAGFRRIRHGRDERGGLALPGVAERAHAGRAEELREARPACGGPERAVGRPEGDALQAVGEPGGRDERRRAA